jgi:hypothetical protein
MRSHKDLEAAVPHIAHDMMLLRMAWDSHRFRVGWTTWYVMARNAAIFFELPDAGGRAGDLRASDFFQKGGAAAGRWRVAKATRLIDAHATLKALKRDASQAAAHLSWDRVLKPPAQQPSGATTRLLLGLWGDFVSSLSEPHKDWFMSAWRALHPRHQRPLEG